MKKKLLFACCFFLQYSFCQSPGSWTLIQSGEDIYNGQLDLEEWPNTNDIESLDLKAVPGGFLTCGYYNDQIFDSTDGNTYDLTGKNGAYLAKYTYDGVLEWLVRTEKEDFEERNVIMSIATDSQNNIYIIGRSDGYLYDNSGEVQAIAPQWPEGGSSPFLMKLDEEGNFIWKTLIVGVYPKRVAVDNNDNVVVGGDFYGQDTGHMFFNDQYVGEWSNITDDDVNFHIAKYASDGMPLWDAGIYIDAVNTHYIEGITFDADNNIYVNGIYEQNLKVYDADEGDYIERGWSQVYGGSMFIAKYTEDGDAQWVVNSDNTTLAQIITNEDGSHFITGTNTVYHNSEGTHKMTNGDGSVTTQNTYGPYYFAKISPEGNWEWLTGSIGSGDGGALEMVKYDDKVAVLGYLHTYNEISVTAELYGTNTFTALPIDVSDYFIATYDVNGGLISVSKSADNNESVGPYATSGLLMDPEGYFIIQRNLIGYLFLDPLDFYGQTIAPDNGNDATLTRFRESDGITVFGTLSTEEVIDVATAITLAPNPTDKHFIINLDKFYPDIDVKISDITGKTVFEQTYNDTDKITAEITGEAGIYLVTVITGNRNLWIKVIKQ